MSTPALASQRARLCDKDGFEMVLDVETARTAVDAGWPVVELYTCRLGHSLRVWAPDELAARRKDARGRRSCAVCGLWLPPFKAKGSQGGRHVHEGDCLRFKQRASRAFEKANPGKPFFIEEQPWYRGIHAPLSAPLPPLDPLAGTLGREWLDGWARVHGFETSEPAA